MKTLAGFKDLEPYGITYLTGEACAIGARALCDLTSAGEKLVKTTLGIPFNAKLNEPANSGSLYGKSVASMLIPYDMSLVLCVFALFTHPETLHVIVDNSYRVHQITQADMDDEDYKLVGGPVEFINKYYGGVLKSYRPLNVPRVGLSNVHQMTGRTW